MSDSGTVVVTEYGGRHRFTYAIHPFGSKLVPLGICTDALSNILVCDGMNSTVQMLNKDGQFLSYLLIRPPGTFRPCSLSYDINTHRLWVGSYNNKKVCVYRYVTRLDTSAGIICIFYHLLYNLVRGGKFSFIKKYEFYICCTYFLVKL